MICSALTLFLVWSILGNLQEIAIASERVGILDFSYYFLLPLLLRPHHALGGVSLVTFSTGMDVERFGQEGINHDTRYPLKARQEKEMYILVDPAISISISNGQMGRDGRSGWMGILSLG
jgi:hypothetical protein